jgi:signal transduction histidine kinase
MGQSLEQFSGLFGKSGRSWMHTIRLWSSDPKSYESGETYSDQITLENGKIVAIHLAPVILRSQLLGTVSIFRDITSEVRIDRLKTEFVANVSHELRTPMTSIKGYVDVLLMGAAGVLNDQQTRFLGVVKNNAQRLNVLVNDLLDVSRIEAGQVTLAIEQLDLVEIARDVISDVQRRSREENKPMTFSLESAPDLPKVEGDQERVRQIMHNLISNSYNYTPSEGLVCVHLWPVDEGVQIDIVDTGIGIQQPDQVRIFERFFRGEDPLVVATAGTGLGLSITKNLVEMHHGRIWFTSSGEPGKGSTFSFILPIQQPGH